MERSKYLLFVSLTALILSSCEKSDRTTHEKGFHVPGGDVVVGESLFTELRCTACHSVAGVELASREDDILQKKVQIGGESYQVTSYGELVTSIIDPNHSISEKYIASLPEEEKTGKITSPMIIYNKDISVQELIDLASFLHTKYVKKDKPYLYYHYPY